MESHPDMPCFRHHASAISTSKFRLEGECISKVRDTRTYIFRFAVLHVASCKMA